MKANQTCRVCGVELDDENWYSSYRKVNRYICKECESKRVQLWSKANPEKGRARSMRSARKRGCRSFNQNKDCPMFLGVHVAERVLSHVFKDAERMPINHPGYDFICNKGKRIDVKSACKRKNRNGWAFLIRHNTIADYFLCLAFDNREDLTPLYAWLIPGSMVNHLNSASISPSTIYKWDEYRLNLTKILDCCKTLYNTTTNISL